MNSTAATTASTIVKILQMNLLFVDSNIVRTGVLQQNKFLADVLASMDKDGGKEIIENLQKVRKFLTEPSNVVLYIAGNLDYLKNPAKSVESFLPPDLNTNATAKK